MCDFWLVLGLEGTVPRPISTLRWIADHQRCFCCTLEPNRWCSVVLTNIRPCYLKTMCLYCPRQKANLIHIGEYTYVSACIRIDASKQSLTFEIHWNSCCVVSTWSEVYWKPVFLFRRFLFFFQRHTVQFCSVFGRWSSASLRFVHTRRKYLCSQYLWNSATLPLWCAFIKNIFFVREPFNYCHADIKMTVKYWLLY